MNEREAVAPKAAPPAKSLAILPFENLSADPDNQYFADGIADDILDALAPIEGLRVAARNSAFSYRGKSVPLSEIGDALHVATVLQGSVRKAGNRMRMAVQLVSVADGYHLWSERFDRELVDVFAVQDEIAAAIAAKLQVTFVAPAEPIGKATTAQVQAFELVAKGRALSTQRGLSLIEARTCLDAAIRLDPENADAHAILSDVLVNFIRYGLMPAPDGIPLVKMAIGRALELDAGMASAIGAQAVLSLFGEHDVTAALAHWERALALQPRLSEVRANYALHGLIFVKQDDERALQEFERAVREDPRNAMVAGLHAIGLAILGRNANSIAEAARACELDPHSFIAWFARFFVLSELDADGALAAAPRVLAMFGRHPLLLAAVGRSYMRIGDRRRAEAVYAELKARVETDLVVGSSLALLADALGYVDEAIEWALESVRRCDYSTPFWTRSGLTMSEACARTRVIRKSCGRWGCERVSRQDSDATGRAFPCADPHRTGRALRTTDCALTLLP
ncbi:hypothetical protein [Gemmatimonas sp.]|uniref:hypothetical protein n=1 Tax=Gemmatimonas sp. TaxID=1962908 RepID=UPI0025BFED87|nr:hypothetical protein [Gemmatimonas sp.]MCA2991644.1 hypothetical protein [Gemmatimonas sp.]